MAATKKGGTVKKAAKAAPEVKAEAPASKTVKAASKKAAPKTTRAASTPRNDAKAKTDAPKAAVKPKASGAGKAVTKKPAAVKLTPKQTDLLSKVQGAGETGFEPSKIEARAIEPLLAKKVVKRGSKNKASGQFRYHVTKLGQKHLSTPAPSAVSPSTTAPAPSATA